MENLFKSAEKVYKKSISFKGYHKFNYYNCFITIFGFKFLATLEAFLLLYFSNKCTKSFNFTY